MRGRQKHFFHVLVTGATGKLGPLLVSELLNRGFAVRVLVRTRSTASFALGRLFAGVDVVYGDVADFESVSKAVSGVQLVFHLAGLLHTNLPPTNEVRLAYERVNVEGTRNVITASRESGVDRVVFFSTTSVYGPGGWERIFDETSSVNPQNPYAESKVRAEKLVAEVNACCHHKPLVTTLRLASVYGTRVAGNYRKLIWAVDKGFFCIPAVFSGEGTNRIVRSEGACRAMIHEQDAVAGAILAAIHPEAGGKIYNLTDGRRHSVQDIVRHIAAALSRKIVIVSVSTTLLSGFVRVVKRVQKKMPAFGTRVSFALEKLTECCWVDGQKIQKELGFVPRYDLKTGWRYAVASKSEKKLSMDASRFQMK